MIIILKHGIIILKVRSIYFNKIIPTTEPTKSYNINKSYKLSQHVQQVETPN